MNTGMACLNAGLPVRSSDVQAAGAFGRTAQSVGPRPSTPRAAVRFTGDAPASVAARTSAPPATVATRFSRGAMAGREAARAAFDVRSPR